MPRMYRKTHTHLGRTIDRTFRTKKLADQWKAEMERKSERIKAGLSVSMDDTRLKVGFAKWIVLRKESRDYWMQDEAKVRTILELDPDFGDLMVRAVTKGNCETALHRVRAHKGLKGATFNRYRMCLHTFFEFMIEEGYRESNPVSKIEIMNEVRRGAHIADAAVEAYVEIAEKQKAQWFFPFVVFAMNAGPRPGELLGFYQSDYQPEIRRIEITRRFQAQLKRVKEGTKGGGGRFIPLNDFTVQVINDYLSKTEHRGPKHFLFHRKDGRPVSPSTLAKIHRRVAQAAGIPDTVRFYDISRHKYASMVTKKLGLRAAQKLLGHSSHSVTERYSHDDPNDLLHEAVNVTVGKKA